VSGIRKPLPPALDVRVTYQNGAYQTQTVRGQRASSTSSAQRAAQTLATKLWADRPATARELRAKGLRAGATLWRLAPADDAEATVATNGASRGGVPNLPPRDAAVASPPADAPACSDVEPPLDPMAAILVGAELVQEVLMPLLDEAAGSRPADLRLRLFAGAISTLVAECRRQVGDETTRSLLANIAARTAQVEADLVGRH
jgi:hypothetical protein